MGAFPEDAGCETGEIGLVLFGGFTRVYRLLGRQRQFLHVHSLLLWLRKDRCKNRFHISRIEAMGLSSREQIFENSNFNGRSSHLIIPLLTSKALFN